MLENNIHHWPGCIGFGIGSALAELDGLIGCNGNTNWKIAPQSAFLLPQNQVLLKTVDDLVKDNSSSKDVLTLKWKIAIESNKKEKEEITNEDLN